MKDPKTGKRPRIKRVAEAKKTDRIPESELDVARKKFMGKKVRLKNHKGNYGIKTWVGTCNFLGYNENLPSWGLQVTIERTPLNHIKLDQLELV